MYSDSANPQNVPDFDPDVQMVRSGWGFWKSCLVLSLGLLTVTMIGCLGGAWYLYRNGASVAANIARSSVERVLRDVELPAEEKAAIMVQIDRLVLAVKERRLGLDKAQTVLMNLQKSPLFAAWLVFAADAKYVQPSGLSEEDKQAGVRVLQRLLHGLYDEKIKLTDLESLQSVIMTKSADGKETPKEKLSDEEVRSLLTICREKVEAANIPDEPFEIRISEEVKRVVDETLGEGK